jgi:glucosamine 6-phosphate synthetase-like amidotransferase/phosphosugar isomerase protein
MDMSDETALMPIAPTRIEVQAQPQVVARVLREMGRSIRDLAQTLVERQVNLVLASGSGDSWFAAQAVRLAWERYAGVPFEALQAYEYATYGRPGEDRQTAHIIISSSGRPTTTWDALDRALDTPAYVVGVTDNPAPDNPFVAKPPCVLIPGAHKVGWPAQTTTATIAVLIDLAIAFGLARGHLDEREASHVSGILQQIPEQMAGVLEQSVPWAEALAPALAKRRLYTFVGGGPSYGVAQTGAALMAEGPQEFGLALAVEEFHHGLRIGTLAQGDPVVLIAPTGGGESRCRDTAYSVRQWGARLVPLVMAGTADLIESPGEGLLLPDVPEPLSPLLTLLPLHALSIALAEQKVAGGYQRPEGVP